MCASDGNRSLSTFFSLTAYKLETTQTFAQLTVHLWVLGGLFYFCFCLCIYVNFFDIPGLSLP